MATEARAGFRLPWAAGSDGSERSTRDGRRPGPSPGGPGARHDRDRRDRRDRRATPRTVHRPGGSRQPAGPPRDQVHGRVESSDAGGDPERPNRIDGPLPGWRPRALSRRSRPARPPRPRTCAAKPMTMSWPSAIGPKAEIARVREETEARIAARKAGARRRDGRARHDDRGAGRPGCGRGRRVRGRVGRLLRAPQRRRGSDPDREDGRDHARSAEPGRDRRFDRRGQASRTSERLSRLLAPAPDVDGPNGDRLRGRRGRGRLLHRRVRERGATRRPDEAEQPEAASFEGSGAGRRCARLRAELHPRRRIGTGERRQYRQLQAQPRSAAGRHGNRGRLGAQWCLRLHRWSPPRVVAGSLDPGHGQLRHPALRRRPTRPSSSRRSIATPTTDAPAPTRTPRSLPWPDPASSLRFPTRSPILSLPSWPGRLRGHHG